MARKPKGQPEEISLLEFQAWLGGIEEMQGEDWAPTLDQWKKIKAKIANIVEEEPEVAPPTPQYSNPGQFNPRVPTVFGAQPQPQQTQIPSSLGEPGYRPPQVFQEPLAPVKTPHIDSSQGYTSSLA